MFEGTDSAVVVAVPAAEVAVAAHRARFDPAAAWGVPAHVTVLYPFLPPSELDEDVLRALAEAVRTVPRFTAEWNATGWFDEDVLWLAPDPADSFRALTLAVFRAFPEFPPYGGEFQDLMPHLTVAHAGTRAEMREVERQVREHLPISMLVTDVQLMCGSDAHHSWQTVRNIPLG
ncbi:2'-5' RNA ligase family protein [Kribbella pittospori]|uniref:2'-5' RNA ligase family protein n=1 Tax=Kribbella pittospori TaxID=722689 RepID=A0A4R0L141_9ACTN|nr:2'-5' RNA ligase family protein [Kribbella pittospori]TCC62255.1 2'-5' RNA ligase family protein [Kribbella pittospori]